MPKNKTISILCSSCLITHKYKKSPVGRVKVSYVSVNLIGISGEFIASGIASSALDIGTGLLSASSETGCL